MLTKNFTFKASELAERSFRAIASDESVDRDDEIIASRAWTDFNGLDNFKQNPVIMYGHDGRNNLPIAKASNIWTEDNKLMVDVAFPPAGTSQLSDECYGLVKSGILKTLSVGFLGRKHIADPMNRRIWTDCELLEISLVAVPSNTSARVIAVKAAAGVEFDLDAIESPADIGLEMLVWSPKSEDIGLESIVYDPEFEVDGLKIKKSELNSLIAEVIKENIK